MPTPTKNETHDEWIKRCMSNSEVISTNPDEAQRYAVCESKWTQHFAGKKISFDYDGVLSTGAGKELALRLGVNNELFIISARHSKDGMMSTAHDVGILDEHIYATGSNNDKIATIKKLGINEHYDNNAEVVHKLGSIGKLFP
jgi:hypothetical protein